MTVNPGRWDFGYSVTYKHGINEKQNNVTLAEPQ